MVINIVVPHVHWWRSTIHYNIWSFENRWVLRVLPKVGAEWRFLIWGGIRFQILLWLQTYTCPKMQHSYLQKKFISRAWSVHLEEIFVSFAQFWPLSGASKKRGTLILFISSPIIDWFSFFFTDTLCRQLAIIWLLYIPPHHECVSTQPCKN